jgi:hypothetical protein
MRKMAIAEGMPSNVGKEELVSKPAKLCDLELYTLTIGADGLIVDTEVTFEMVRGGPWDSICAYERVSSVQARWEFDGSPAAKSVHWRQVRFALPDVRAVAAGEYAHAHMHLWLLASEAHLDEHDPGCYCVGQTALLLKFDP